MELQYYFVGDAAGWMDDVISIDGSPVVWVVIHIGDGEVFAIYGTVEDMKAIEVFDIAGVTMGNAVLVEATGSISFLDGAAFLLAVATHHENISKVFSLSCIFCGVTPCMAGLISTIFLGMNDWGSRSIRSSWVMDWGSRSYSTTVVSSSRLIRSQYQ